MAAPRICSVAGCGKKHNAKGYCVVHYQRFLRHGDPIAGTDYRPPTGEPEVFLQSAIAFNGDECLEWPFARLEKGYGIVGRRKGTRLVHRIVCEAAYGPMEGMDAAHSCGNPPCCNPRHIRWATRSDNHADRVRHGTDCRGEKSGTAKLTGEQVNDIRRQALSRSLTDIASEYGVSVGNVSLIVSGKTWTDI